MNIYIGIGLVILGFLLSRAIRKKPLKKRIEIIDEEFREEFKEKADELPSAEEVQDKIDKLRKLL